MNCNFWVAGIVVAGMLGAGPATTFSQETTNVTEVATNRAEAASDSQQILRSYLQLQEQLHSALLAIEQSRQEADAAAKSNAESLVARLRLIEQALGANREQELQTIQASNRFTLILAGAFGGVGVLAILLIAWFQVRAMNRLAEMAALTRGHLLGGAAGATLGVGGQAPMGLPEGSATGGRLLTAIERLEHRLGDLERTAREPLPPGEPTGDRQGDPTAVIMGSDNAEQEQAQRLSMLLGKGQSLLNLNQPEDALGCFEEALSLDPTHPEAWVKKGTALERLKKLEAAIDCYDRAIAANQSMTLAYLCKGGVYNQLERFSEALECYEQALRSQQKSGVTHSTASSNS